MNFRFIKDEPKVIFFLDLVSTKNEFNVGLKNDFINIFILYKAKMIPNCNTI